LNQTAQRLKNANFLILTFGTAFRYFLKDINKGLANCHKMPGQMFQKSLSNIQELSDDFSKTLLHIKEVNPGIHIILSLSPVRHTKDGLLENMLSKSLLRVLCAELSKLHTNLVYFPAYEIMMDELRDYRYYKSDLIHPSDLAEEIIYDRFVHTFLSADALKRIQDFEEIRTSLKHKVRNLESKSAKEFQKTLLQKLKKYPTHFDSEIIRLESAIQAQTQNPGLLYDSTGKD
jgi:hypothetical protein